MSARLNPFAAAPEMIAAMTAFLVVNVNDTRIPGFVVWLLPTAVLVPFIVRWSRQLQIPRKS